MKQPDTNPQDLSVLLQVTDAHGLPRISFKEVITMIKQGKAPRGYVFCMSLLFGQDSYTRFVPEAALNPERYKLEYVLNQLHKLKITDEVLLAYLLYLLDYGRVDGPMMKHLEFAEECIEKEDEVTQAQLDSTVNWLMRWAKATYPLETRNYEQELEERKVWADELASMQVVDREAKLNPYGFPVILTIFDPAGQPRPILTSIVQRMRAAEHIPGFIDNPYKEMHTCRYLCTIPEFSLGGGCDLQTLWRLLKKLKISNDPYNTIFMAHATDWGRVDNECMMALQNLGKGFTPDNPFMYVARQLEKKAIANGTLVAGGRANSQIIKEMKHRRKL